jgi:recombinational DNA repair protein RecR
VHTLSNLRTVAGMRRITRKIVTMMTNPSDWRHCQFCGKTTDHSSGSCNICGQ